MGIVSALGCGKAENLAALKAGRSGIAPVRYLQTGLKDFPVGEVPLSDEELAARTGAPAAWPRTALLSILALQEALAEANPEAEACTKASLRDPSGPPEISDLRGGSVRANAPERVSSPGIFDGILADLGVSAHQFDTAGRGFSFRFEDAPLDMRMNREARRTAADLVNEASEAELERILRLYGEVDGARSMARLIAAARSEAPLRTTGDLDRAIARMLPRGAEHKVLAKVYQALRIEVNQEMRSLEKFLDGACRSLKPGGRLVVITYHSLEDRMVKNFIKTGNVEGEMIQDMYGRVQAPLEAVNRKPILPSEEEIAGNTRARSAKLRIAERRAEE
jgi:16S rRNA (cytosine1402-N4)-methyltransferase